jgi:SAM-dependent methyltransferase
MLTLLYAATVVLSAFLLFQIQPVIARMILPWFGGSSAVWSVCMLFFQVGLMSGYAYAHGLARNVSPRRQAALHGLLLAASLLLMPAIPGAAWKPTEAGNPPFRILLMLTATVGLPYFLLSATSPLVQSWYARTHRGAVPYRLFSLSNLASLAGLFSYPFVMEPYFAVRTQALAWSWGYAVFAVLCAATAWTCTRTVAGASLPEEMREEIAAPPASLRTLWVLLAACPSILLLSVTTYLTQDVASIPFLWILPLGVYLLSFVLCFESGRYYRRRLFFRFSGVALAATCYLLTLEQPMLHVGFSVSFLTVSLFVWCMTCHGELARLKPHPRHLTVFYLMVAVGGAAGGIFVGLIAPAVFNGYYEFPAGLALGGFLMATVLWREGKLVRAMPRAMAAVLLTCMLVMLGAGVRNSLHGCRLVVRNFYGQLRVRDSGGLRRLFHGMINHGQQVLDPAERRRSTAYYCPGTGVGLALAAPDHQGARRVGILGLGCGTLASYGRAGDVFRLYEINPLVLRVARGEFTFLGDSRARVDVALGDARLVLESEAPQRFDVLAVDVFSGDSVPVHMLTREAFAVYFRHLRPDGVLAVHISNLYLDLEPVVAAAAQAYGKTALVFDFVPSQSQNRCFPAKWVLVMDPAVAASSARFAGGSPAHAAPKFRAWTDDYSSLFSVMR